MHCKGISGAQCGHRSFLASVPTVFPAKLPVPTLCQGTVLYFCTHSDLLLCPDLSSFVSPHLSMLSHLCPLCSQTQCFTPVPIMISFCAQICPLQYRHLCQCCTQTLSFVSVPLPPDDISLCPEFLQILTLICAQAVPRLILALEPFFSPL